MKKSVKVSLIVVTTIFVVIALAIGFMFLIIDPDINVIGAPDVDMTRLTSYTRTIKILDKDGQPLCDALYGNKKTYVKSADLSDDTVNAFIAIEDKRFFEHNGVDYRRIASAVLSNIKSKEYREGASTITQQLIKNTHLSNEKTLKRKIYEIRLARQLEKKLDKKQILECYFNILYFGSGIHGLGTASRVMFGIPASELSLSQSAALASIINNPSKYSPYNGGEALEARRKLVLKLMYEQEMISQSEYDAACNEVLTYEKNTDGRFIECLIKSACDKIDCPEDRLFSDGYTLYTSYDKTLSDSAKKAIADMGDINGNIRVLVLDNESGGVLCDEANYKGSFEHRRSPASTIKPFVSYIPALESGYNTLSQILDKPTEFYGYSPKNYKDVYRGWQSLEQCLINSSNIAAVKLLNDVGVDKATETANSFGFNIKEASLPLALGGMTEGVTLTELANAYRTLANGGIYSPAFYIQKISDADQVSVYTKKDENKSVIPSDTAYITTKMLTQCAKEGTAKKLKNVGIIAAKTGTNGDEKGNHDCYCIAYTPSVTIAVWFGSDETPLDNGITGATCCDIICKMCEDGVIDTSVSFDMPSSCGYYDADARELSLSHEVYLADPCLPKRYRMRALFSKRHLPLRNTIRYIDYFDRLDWEKIYSGGMTLYGPRR